MAWVYILRGKRRYYVGATDNLERRLTEHNRGTIPRIRFGTKPVLVAAKQLPPMTKARMLERKRKRKKNPQLAIFVLNSTQI